MLKRSITASIALLGATTALTLSATTFANDHQGEINPWQHCGIGAAIFDDNTTAAAISNVIWDSGTTAVTSATISPGSCEGEEIKVAQFIDETYDQLAMEAAMGEGNHLAAALGLVGCDAGDATSISQLRSDLSAVSADSSYSSMSHNDKAYSFYTSLNQAAANCSAS
ncbi:MULTISPECIES: DUF3015 family protein [Halomonadaceae]|uniref:DUF3015 family protein n=1 Tax=Vreelandella maris TaxID=2729617 RepID=A0A7Y6R999_9GAMM|nr:DUF3015 family protein [Halomonas maris]NVF12711.1 DUF3015 family protein [Halomonas maris]|tara:strand:+ start:130 stop:633 length:504 start_codon:yes stop_codon:yes gene_type:complete